MVTLTGARDARAHVEQRLGLGLRPPGAGEYPAWRRRVGATFGRAVPGDEIDREQQVVDLSRALGAWDTDGPVATAITFDMPLTVPGGARIAGAGVSMVTVAPTHRRRGLLSAMMATLLDEARARGEAVAMLYASAGRIYRRFGFGVATGSVTLTVPASARPDRRRAADAPVRLLSCEAARARLPAIDEAVAARTTGAVRAPAIVWTGLGHPRSGEDRPLQIAVLGEAGAERGYVTYRVALDWRARTPAASDGVLTVEHLTGLDADAVLTLWDHVLSVDLVERCEARLRPVDDPLLHAAADRLAIGACADEPLWLCLLDVPAALRQRRWCGDGAVTLDVGLPDGGRRRWELDVRGGTADVAPTDGPPDLRLDLADLSAVYLGGTSVRGLAQVGLVEELTTGAAGCLDGLLRSWPAPWCGWHF